MKTFLAQNQFLNSTATPEPPAVGSAVALSRTSVPDAQTGAAADLIYECENCIGMIEHGCYCQAMGAVAPGGPCAEPIPQPAGSPAGETSIASACAPMSSEKRAPAVPDAENGCCGAVRELHSNPAPTEAIPEPSMVNGGDPGAPASAPTKNPDAGALGTDCIGEIFFYARKLMTGEIPAFVLDEARFLADIEETPLFLREDGYLKRQA